MDSQRSGLANGGGSSSARVSTMSNGHRVVHFPLSRSCALKIQKGDITQWSVDGSSDAIVNPANQRMLGGAGTDGAIHRAAGKELRAACYDVEEVERGIRCPTGEARITQGFNLPASHVIHTVGPIYDVDPNPEASLRSAYRSSLRVAKQNNIQYIAYTAISCGNHRYPLDEAATIAISTVRELANDFKEDHHSESSFMWKEKLKHSAYGIVVSGASNIIAIGVKVHFVHLTDEAYNVWLDKANELLHDQ